MKSRSRIVAILTVTTLVSGFVTGSNVRAEGKPRPARPAPETVVQKLDKYSSPLVGDFNLPAWGVASNGMRCRVGLSDLPPGSYDGSPMILLEVQNVAATAVKINDLLHFEMMPTIDPIQLTPSEYHYFGYYGHDFQWLFERALLNKPLPPNGIIRAVCRVPPRILPLDKKYKLKLVINRGVYPAHTKGHPIRGDWWTGVMESNTVVVSWKSLERSEQFPGK